MTEKPANEPASHTTDVSFGVPTGMRLSAEFAWRFLVIAAAIGVVVWLVSKLAVLSTTLAIALLLAALIAPMVELLVRKAMMPRGLAVAVAIVAGLSFLGALITFVIVQFADGLPALQQQLNRSLDEIKRWLTEGPLALETRDINQFIDRLISYIQENQASITTGALTTAGAVGQFLTGFVLTLFILIFFLLNGDRIWSFLLHAVPVEGRQRADVAGRRGFASLISYVRATFVVAIVDAVGIGIGLWIVGVPLVIPLATLVFLGAFVPILGAVLTGAVAVLVALVSVGWIKALIVLGVVILVQQVESNLLHPLLLGRAVKLHPLAVILAITAGFITAGITGALLAVPLVAVLNAGAKSLANDEAAEVGDDVPILSRKGADPDVVARDLDDSDGSEDEE